MAHAAETGTFRGDWVRFIYGTSRIADSTRVLMLALSEAMDESGRVEAARDDIANLLSRAPGVSHPATQMQSAPGCWSKFHGATASPGASFRRSSRMGNR